MAPSTPWLLAFLLPLLQGAQAQPSCVTKADCGEGQFCRLPDGACVPPGVCQEIPFVCTMDYRPVCGCDDKTYGNRCGAFGAGMSVKAEGECTPSSPASSVPPPTGPTPGQAKEEAGREGGRQRHKRDLLHMDGWASGEETLLLRVEKAISSSSSSSSSSSQEDNEAAAVAAAAAGGAGVVPSQEPQGLLQRRCGSRGLPACLEGEWCDFVEDGTCGETDGGGVCTRVRLGCNRMYMPVCGCDGQTHPNACVARSKEVSVRHEGPCPSSSQPGAGTTATPTATATVAVAKTLSLPLPPPPPSPVVHPLASPSSTTPPSSHSALTDVWQANGGRGSEGGTACGGLQAKACPAGQACIFPRGTCGAADELGTCFPPPFICALIYQPVCGCNGQTFSNECYAHASAISVSAQGPCPPPTPATGAAAPSALQQNDVRTIHAEAMAAAEAAVAAAVAAAEAIANGGGASPKGGAAAAAAAEEAIANDGATPKGGGAAAAAGPAVTQKNVEEEYLRGGRGQGGGRRG